MSKKIECLITDRNAIRKELGKTDEDVFKDIKIIKEWLTTQPHLPETPNDQMIEYFLTSCKYSIEKTKQNLDMYYTVRELLPDMYRKGNPNSFADMEAVYSCGDYIILPKLTPSLYRISLVKFRKDKLDKADMVKINAHFLANMYEVRIQEDLAMGDVCIVDYENVTFGLISQMTPLLLKQYAFVYEKIHSNRLKSLHLVNPPGYVSNVIAIFKSFLKKKLQDRIFTHKNMDELFKYIPQEYFPSDYGGKQKSIEELRELWKLKMNEYKERLDYLRNLKVYEDLRPEILENDDLLGYHGNFKKLDVD